MRARHHGEPIPEQTATQLDWSLRTIISDEAAPSVGFMFPELVEHPQNKLPVGAQTITALTALGKAMAEEPSDVDSRIPAAYTYFGQFIDHDITNTQFPGHHQNILKQPDFTPIPSDEIGVAARNARTLKLDLESVYLPHDSIAPPPVGADGSMGLGIVSAAPFGTITTADKNHDLPRLDKDPNNEDLDRRARIGDPRNDENLLVAQLHVAFLRSHNVVLKRDNLSAEDARIAMRRRYQWAILHDFLPRVCHGPTVQSVLSDGPTAWPITDWSKLFMPVEFAAAAYRFGHSMVRGGYNHNETFPAQPFFRFFTFTALSGNMEPGPDPDNPPDAPPPIMDQPDTLPDNWIIDWSRFFSPSGDPQSPGSNPARKIDTRITPALAKLPDAHGFPVADIMGKLAIRNLLRGYLLGLPTGQAVAKRLGEPALSVAALEAAIPSSVLQTVRDAGLIERTPLWFYVLAEAGDPAGPDGQSLGPVGSRIVAETLWNLVKAVDHNVIDAPPSQSDIDTGEFTLKGIVRIGLDAKLPPLLDDDDVGA